MDFDLSEEQQLLHETINQFLDNECPMPRLRELFDGSVGHDPALWQGLSEMGIAGLCVPEAYGGAGMELLDLAVAAEALGTGAAPGVFFGHSLATLAISLAGSEEQKRKWLPELASGEKIGTVALGEEGGNWNPSEWSLPAGERLRGEKVNVPHATHADLLVVGLSGGALGVVETGADGLEVEDMGGVDHTRSIGRLGFAGTPCELLADGPGAAGRVRDAALILLAADAYAAAKKLLDMTVAYANTREQFGVTIGHFQALKHQLANMAAAVEPTRALYWYAAHAFDHIQDESERSAVLAKAHITETAMQAARDSVEAHGGLGFTWECDVQIWFKRIMFDRAFLGTPAVHRERAAQLAGW